jgi:2-oxoisovalerate dehydrogenase E2 component (dihydrolipoyl transacylase)
MLELKLHDIGEGMTEGEILHYFVKPGDEVISDQPLVEVQTDKMTAELPSPGPGVIKEILITPGTTVQVGTTLLLIESSRTLTPAKKGKSTSQAHTVVSAVNNRVLAAPYTRKIARENGVNIEQVTGTGQAGRITDNDVYRYMAEEKQENNNKQRDTVKPVLENVKIESSDRKLTKTSTLKEHQYTTIPFTGRRKQIAKKMIRSLHTIPHVTHFEEIDMTELLAWKNELKHLGSPVSVPAFFIKALTIALADFPVFNARLDEENELIHLNHAYHIGIATDTEDGLIVPVIRHAESKKLNEIQSEIKQLTKKAQENKLSGKEITGSTFTISNVGPLGSIGATPIINFPETALMAFHATKDKPAVHNGEIAIRSLMNVSMSFDHRVADGGTAVAFTNRFKKLIEHPKLLLLELV